MAKGLISRIYEILGNGSQKTQLVNGAGTVLNTATLALDATLTGGSQIAKVYKASVVSTTINNATFSATVTGSDIDLTNYSNIIITWKTGTRTGTATMDIKFQVKDSAGNYIDHTTLTQIAAAGSGYEEIFGLAHRTGRVVCTFGGTNDFATTTVELTAAN